MRSFSDYDFDKDNFISIFYSLLCRCCSVLCGWEKLYSMYCLFDARAVNTVLVHCMCTMYST